MGFRIAYPVDAGTPEDSFLVVVRKQKQRQHSIKSGGVSRLGNKSGASFVYERLRLDETSQYYFEFDIIGKDQPANTRLNPEDIFGSGTSDAVACVLGFRQDRDGSTGKDPLVCISCSLEFQDIAYGLDCLKIEKVTEKDNPSSLKSLKNKWAACKKNKAIALVLYEEDAQLLCRDNDSVKQIPLSENTFAELAQKAHSDSMPVVVCKRDDYSLLSTALGIAPPVHGIALSEMPAKSYILQAENPHIQGIVFVECKKNSTDRFSFVRKYWIWGFSILLSSLFIALLLFITMKPGEGLQIRFLYTDRQGKAIKESDIPQSLKSGTYYKIRLICQEKIYVYFYQLDQQKWQILFPHPDPEFKNKPYWYEFKNPIQGEYIFPPSIKPFMLDNRVGQEKWILIYSPWEIPENTIHGILQKCRFKERGYVMEDDVDAHIQWITYCFEHI
ncbi:MAG: hypothetical protein HUU50_10220 [Candidatus Brocadiae bacterium]|nr:hypothetical protein [Candidatus Brocadiia bacterium]